MLPPHNPSDVGSIPTVLTIQNIFVSTNRSFTSCGSEIVPEVRQHRLHPRDRRVDVPRQFSAPNILRECVEVVPVCQFRRSDDATRLREDDSLASRSICRGTANSSSPPNPWE